MGATTLYRFRLEVSDIDRNRYETLDFRLAMHPSETAPYLITRVLAFALNTDPDLAFAASGLSDPDAPGLSAPDPNGGVRLWIEIGNPSARKTHRASKAARALKIYTYKDPEALLRELRAETIHKAEAIEIYSIAPEFMRRLETLLERDSRWSVLFSDGVLNVSMGDRTESGDLRRHSILTSP